MAPLHAKHFGRFPFGRILNLITPSQTKHVQVQKIKVFSHHATQRERLNQFGLRVLHLDSFQTLQNQLFPASGIS